MKREFNGYQGQKKASVRKFIIGCFWIILYLTLFLEDRSFKDVVMMSICFAFLLHAVISLHHARKSTLILDYEGITFITPLMNVKTSWQNISLVGMKDLPPQQYAISSPDMDLETTS